MEIASSVGSEKTWPQWLGREAITNSQKGILTEKKENVTKRDKDDQNKSSDFYIDLHLFLDS